MADSSKSFAPSSSTDVNAVKRLPKRADYDAHTIYSILDSSLVAHVAFDDPKEDWPMVIPMIFARHEDEIYLHGHINSRLLKTLSTEGTRCCISVAQVHGLVLALSSFHNSMNYKSVNVFGEARLMGDDTPAELESKTQALTLITNHPFKVHGNGDRWNDSRPVTPAEIKSTRVICVKIETASAKVREGGPNDEKKDRDNEETLGKVWVGHVERKEEWTRAMKADYGKVDEEPSYVARLMGKP